MNGYFPDHIVDQIYMYIWLMNSEKMHKHLLHECLKRFVTINAGYDQEDYKAYDHGLRFFWGDADDGCWITRHINMWCYDHDKDYKYIESDDKNHIELIRILDLAVVD